MGQIYISTLAFKGKSPEEIIDMASTNNFAIEFTSSFNYVENVEPVFLQANIKKLAHNYFPVPKSPFVLNLASQNEIIRKQSISHCLNGLEISKKSQSPFYAAHAGFCIDPNPRELGNRILTKGRIDRNLHRALFISSLEIILERAKALEIHFLVENNVLIPENLTETNENPFLCCESSEISWIFDCIDSSYFGLLLDTAHLKVSCKTLGLDQDEQVEDLRKYIRAIHHSDNDGLRDNNQPLKKGYWFLRHMKHFTDLVQVIEVKDIDIKCIKEQISLLNAYGG